MKLHRTLPSPLLLVDCVLTLIVFNVFGHFREISGHFMLWPVGVPFGALVIGTYLIDGYRARTDFLSLDYASLHIIAALAAMLGTLLFTFAFLPAGYELQSSRGVIALSFIALIPLTLGYRRLQYLQQAADRGQSSLVYLGNPAGRVAFREQCDAMGQRQPVIFAAWEESPEESGLPPFGKILDEVEAGSLAVEAIVLRESNRELSPEIAQRLVRLYFAGVPTYTLELFYQVYWRKIPLYRLNPTWLFQEGFRITRDPVYERLKRASDLVLAGLGILISLPLMAVAVAAICLEDRAWPLFRQTRIGRQGVPFRLVKLRTMRAGSDEGDRYTQPGDARVTRIGRFLRASRLDEVPQLWNVLRGDMSLIGPRAEWDRLVADYERQIPCYHYRHLVKPGITGWAQVNYLYGANLEDTVRKLEYDLYYIRHFSFRLDASIVLKTVQIMLFGRGR